MTQRGRVTTINPGTISRKPDGKLRYHASFVVRAKCAECDGTGKRWSNAYQGWHPSRECCFCKGTGAARAVGENVDKKSEV